MATAAEKQLYPLSTEDAQSIPLDIILPQGLLYQEILVKLMILLLKI